MSIKFFYLFETLFRCGLTYSIFGLILNVASRWIHTTKVGLIQSSHICLYILRVRICLFGLKWDLDLLDINLDIWVNLKVHV